MKCDNCIYGADIINDNGDLIGKECRIPDSDIAEINNKALMASKAIWSCIEHTTKKQARNEHCKEEALLDKAEEMRQSQ